jgi:hypothetical protein
MRRRKLDKWREGSKEKEEKKKLKMKSLIGNNGKTFPYDKY